MQLQVRITCHFQIIFNFYTFSPRFSNILPFFTIFLKNRMHVLSRIGPGQFCFHSENLKEEKKKESTEE